MTTIRCKVCNEEREEATLLPCVNPETGERRKGCPSSTIVTARDPLFADIQKSPQPAPVKATLVPIVALEVTVPPPVDILLHCPVCMERHIDKGKWVTKPHHTHACQYCGLVWRPAVVDTRGVQFLPGFGP